MTFYLLQLYAHLLKHTHTHTPQIHKVHSSTSAYGEIFSWIGAHTKFPMYKFRIWNHFFPMLVHLVNCERSFVCFVTFLSHYIVTVSCNNNKKMFFFRKTSFKLEYYPVCNINVPNPMLFLAILNELITVVKSFQKKIIREKWWSEGCD